MEITPQYSTAPNAWRHSGPCATTVAATRWPAPDADVAHVAREMAAVCAGTPRHMRRAAGMARATGNPDAHWTAQARRAMVIAPWLGRSGPSIELMHALIDIDAAGVRWFDEYMGLFQRPPKRTLLKLAVDTGHFRTLNRLFGLGVALRCPVREWDALTCAIHIENRRTFARPALADA